MAAELPPRPSASEVEDALAVAEFYDAVEDTVARRLAAEVLHLRARVAALRTPPAGEVADVWLQGIIDDRPEGAYEGRDVYDHRGALLAMHELTALRARVADLEAERNVVDVEYGVRYATGTTHKAVGHHEARYTTTIVDGSVVVQRDVYAPGPWKEAT